MIRTARAIVTSIEYIDEDITKFTALIGSKNEKCINYNGITGALELGDDILVNTTAVDLKLGTGGYHFVAANLTRPFIDNIEAGHIMKLKYTPLQLNCMAVEAQESQYHSIFSNFKSLDEMPVIVGTLHSMAAPCSVYIKNIKPDIKISYIMTDGGALPIYISDIIKQLKKDGIIDSTITYGNAFGGDYECINIYTALITAKEIAKADVAIVCMGPGIVGTDTKYGFSGIEQGHIIDAVNRLGGFAIQAPRISFADNRERHLGISHHSITVLRDICCTKANIAIPNFQDKNQLNRIKSQIFENKINSLHNINYVDYDDIFDILFKNQHYLNKMGKGLSEDKEYFICSAAAGKLALFKLNSDYSYKLQLDS